MIKRIKDLEEMKKVVEVGDKIEISDILDSIPRVGTLVTDPNYKDYYNVLFEDGKYGDTVGIKYLSTLLESYNNTWDNVVLVKYSVKNKNDDFESSIGSTFKIYIEPYVIDCYCGKATLLNFNPSGQSVFLDKNGKLLIVRTSEIKYMKCIDK